MAAPHLVPVGRVGRPHGVDGAFVVERASADPRRYEVGATLRVDGAEATITLSRRVGGGRRAIKLDRPVERGATLCVAADDLPPPAPGHFYVHELVGLDVVDESGALLGHVADVLEGVANDNLVLDSGSLVPMIEDAVREVDLAGGRVVVVSEYAL
jgi:16S rRNA processing protein RimM